MESIQASDIVLLCISFFIIGFVIAAIWLIVCRLRVISYKRKKGFTQPAKFVPTLNLDYEQVQRSVDDSNASKDFKKL